MALNWKRGCKDKYGSYNFIISMFLIYGAEKKLSVSKSVLRENNIYIT